MASRFTIELMDFDRDRIQTSFDGRNFTEEGANYEDVYAEQTALKAAIQAITLGAVTSEYRGGNYFRYSPAKPSDGEVQTNVQWRLIFQADDTGERFTTRIGTADLGLATLIGGGLDDYTGLDISSGPGAALKSAFEDYVRIGGSDSRTATLIAVVYVQ